MYVWKLYRSDDVFQQLADVVFELVLNAIRQYIHRRRGCGSGALTKDGETQKTSPSYNSKSIWIKFYKRSVLSVSQRSHPRIQSCSHQHVGLLLQACERACV